MALTVVVFAPMVRAGRQEMGHREVKTALVERRGLTLKGGGTVCPGEAAFELIPALRLFSEPARATPSGPAGLVRLIASSTSP